MKVFQERYDEIVVFCFAGLAGELLHAVRRAVVVVETVVPRHEGVAVDLFRDAARHHELHPAIKDGVVVLPSAVQLLHLGYHALKGVERLSVPWTADDRAGDDLLPCGRQRLHDGAHLVEVLLAPERDIKIAGHGIGILPEVEVEAPLAGFGQHAVGHLQHDGQREREVLPFRRGFGRGFQRQRALVGAGLGVGRHFDVEPERSRRLCLYLHRLDGVEAVGHEEGVLAVLEDIGQDIAHEVLLHGRGRDDVASALEVADGKRDVAELFRCGQHGLGRDALSAPGTKQGRLCRRLRHL